MMLIMCADHRRLFDTAEASSRQLQQGESLFLAGEASHIALVRKGLLHLLRSASAGATVILKAAGPGDILAEASAYSPVYHCGAVAAYIALVSLLPMVASPRGLRETPTLAGARSAHLPGSVQSARMLAEIRTLRTVAERLDT